MPWWLRGDAHAVVLGNKIYIRPGAYAPRTAEGVRLLGHELVHVEQFARDLNVFKYLWASRRGYRQNPYEVEAYAREKVIVASFCESNPGANGCRGW
ncbi:MAG: DUF4157 domain-containing protein [Gammaproteobacteria bacterium]|nr:DUF4157 domain-containing protein [Gammaproteobacteria bacterium]MYF31084.1 DUF4157 domain-containing protein [Gammaproteobacteria bacterium]MYK28565.1 DUF4157 domain-containing protein [Gammaproteobacteria bacterium]